MMGGVQGVDLFDLASAHSSKCRMWCVFARVGSKAIDAESECVDFFRVIGVVRRDKHRRRSDSAR